MTNNIVVLAALNAKHIHTSLALRSIKASCGGCTERVELVELTINDREDRILSTLYEKNPAALAFSCYIWNIELIKKLLPELRKLLPDTKIILGGPEAAYGDDAPLVSGLCDVVACGEGEENFPTLAGLALNGRMDEENLSHVNGIKYMSSGVVAANPVKRAAFGELPFAYGDYIPDGRIVYYESSRGCPFGCTYCMSGAERGVRYRPLDKVKCELKELIDKNVKLVKFVDRTFNAEGARAAEIWRFLMDEPNTTAFHFEIAADLLDDGALTLLKDARAGLFQFEIGVQSANPEALGAVRRKTDLARLSRNVSELKKSGNIRLHLDLIAGLPGEGYASFAHSFDFVYSLGPHHIQLGFLKLLPGTGLRAEAASRGIVHRDAAPYEVLYTRDISYAELVKLKRVEEAVGLVYNSGAFKTFLRYAAGWFGSAFDFYESFADFCFSRGASGRSAGRAGLTLMLYEYAASRFGEPYLMKDLLKFDACLSGDHKFEAFWPPERTDAKKPEEARRAARKFAANGRRVHIEAFSCNVAEWADGTAPVLREKANQCAFVYPTEAGGAVRYEIL